MTLSLRIHNIETIKTELANARKGISKLGKIKKKHRNILHNIDNVLRRELDTSPYQTILTPGGLWIDYDPDLKKGKVKKYHDNLVKEPFAKLYTKPNKEAMQQAMNEDFKVMFGESHVATIEYTKFKEEEIPKEEKPSIFGRGKDRWKPNIGMEGAPKNSVIKAYYSGFATDGDFSRQIYSYRSFGSNNDKKLADILERANSGWRKGYKIVPYEPWGLNEDYMNRNYKLVILTWGDFIPQLSLSRVDETKAKPGDIENENISVKIAGLPAKRYKYRDRNHDQYVLLTSAASWMLTVERSRDKLFTSVERTTVIQKENGKRVDYHRWIPISYIQIYNKDDPDDIAYDGPFEDLI
jgi:hypothetical protein